MKSHPFKTVRFRIAAWNALGVSLVSFLALLGVRQGVWWAIQSELDQNLYEDSREIDLALSDQSLGDFTELTDALERKAIGHQHHEWFVALYGADNSLIWSSSGDGEFLDRLQGLGGGLPATIQGSRALETKPRANEYDVARVVVGSSLNMLYYDMGRIDRIVLAAALAILWVAPICGYWLAGRATRAVGEITETASRLRPDRLDERLRLAGTGDEFDHLALTINHLLDRIASYIEQRRDFLASSAHELRTPLAAIRSSIEVALANDRSAETYRELLTDIMEEGLVLEMLVNQLLLLSETEGDPEHKAWEPVALDEVTSRAADMFAGVSEAREIELVVLVEHPVMVEGNRSHLRQVVNNLVDNAIKYTASGGKVDVTLRTLNGMAELIVSDTGIGIAEEDLGKVFERFFRTDRARSRDQISGTGLGLSICKAVVETHGGTIHCASQLGKGTTMTVRLPTLRR